MIINDSSMVRRGKKKPKKENQTEKKWENMQYDMLLKIFTAFNQMDLILNFSRVSPSWSFVCSDPTLWHTLDLRVLSDYFDVPNKPFAWLNSFCYLRLLIILKNAFALSHGSISTLIFHFYICIADQHLLCAAQSCPNLKRLVLPAWHKISENGFKTAVQQWRGLESMIVARNTISHQIMMLSIGLFCDHFTQLKIMSPVDLGFATSISNFVPTIKILSLRCSILHRDALLHLLNNLKHLEVLNISHCLLVNVDSDDGPVFVSWHLDAAIVEKASRLREFYACRRDSCRMCRREFLGEGMLIWHDYEECLLRMDEIGSFAH